RPRPDASTATAHCSIRCAPHWPAPASATPDPRPSLPGTRHVTAGAWPAGIRRAQKNGRGQCPARACFLLLASLPVDVPARRRPAPCFRASVQLRSRRRAGTGHGQNVTLQPLSVPVSPLPLSLTRRFHSPLRLSPDRSTV